MLSSIFIIFIHALTPCYWTSEIESGVEIELTTSGIQVRTKSYHLPDLGQDPLTILDQIKKLKPTLVVMTNDLDGKGAQLPEEIKRLGYPLFFAGKKIEVSGNTDLGSCGVYGRQNYLGSVEAVEEITKSKIKKVGIVSSPSPLLKLLVQNFREDVKDREIIQKEVVSFGDWAEAVDNLIHKEKVDVLLPFLPYGGTYKGEPTTVKHWPHYAEALLKINKSTPTIGGGSIRNSEFPVLLAFAQDPSGLGKQVATKIYLHLKNGDPLQTLGFSKPNYFELQINMEELNRLKRKLPEQYLSYATLLNHKENALEGYRNELDNLDRAIAKLLKERQYISLEMGKYKKENNLPVISDKEEQYVLERKIKKCVEVGLDPSFAEDFSKMVVKHSKIIQYEEAFGVSADHLKVSECSKTELSWWESIKGFLWGKTSYQEKHPRSSTPN